MTPSAASATAVTLYVQITGATVGAITAQASADDFEAVFLPITIPAGSTAPVVVSTTVAADTATEGPEGFQAKLLDSTFNLVAGVAAVTGTITEGVSAGKTFTLTTSIDNIASGTGDDTINGTMNFGTTDGTLDTSSTLNPGDQLGGGAGTDTAFVTLSGGKVGASADYTVTPAVTGVEKFLVNNVSSDTDSSVVFDMSLADANLATVGNNSSNNSGVTTKFANLNNLVGVELAGRANVSASFVSGAVAGTADAVTVTLKGAGVSGNAATFTTAGVETLNVVSNTTSNFAKLSDTAATKVVVTGDKAAFIDANLGTNTALKTVDATAATGAVSVDLSGGAFTGSAVTLGAAGGTVYMGTHLSATDTITGGAGSADALAISYTAGADVVLSTAAKSITGFERVEVSSTGTGTNVVNVDGIAGVNTVATGNVTSMVYDFGNAAADAGATSTVTIGINGTSITTASIATSAAVGVIATAVATAVNAANIGVTASAAAGVVTFTTAANSGISITSAPTFSAALSAGAVTGITTQVGNDYFFSNLAAGTTVEVFGGKGGLQAGTTVQRDDVSALLKDASGTADAQAVVLKAGAGASNSYTLDNLILTGAESVSIDAAGGLASTQTYTISALNNASMKTLTLSGSSKLTLDGVDSTVLTKIDGAAATGALTLNLDDTAVDASVVGGSGNDSFVFGDKLNNKDTVDGGAGTDSLSANIAGLTATTGALNISNVETLNLSAAGSNATIAAAGASLVTLSGANSGSTVSLTGLVEAAKVGLGDGAGTAYTGTISAALATATGTADSLNIVLNTTAAQTGAIVKTTGVETLNIVSGTDTAGTALVLDNNTLNLASADATKVTVTATSFGATKTVDLGTLNKATTTVDASGLKNATFTVSAASATAATNITAGQSGNNITGSSVADTFTVAAFDVTDVINGGDGSDILNASITADATVNAGSKVTNIETLNFTVGAGAKLEYTESDDLSAAAVKKITVTGGNTSSTFKSDDTGTAFIGADDTNWLGYDASTFGGKSDITIGANGLNSVESYKAGVATTDILRVSVGAATVGANNTISGFENVVLTSTADTAVFNTTGLTGATNLWASGANSAKFTNVASGVTVNMGSQATQAPGAAVNFTDAKTLQVDLASASGTADALTINLNKQSAVTTGVTLQTNGVENLTLNATTAAADFNVLVGNTATTDQSITLTGGKSASTVSIAASGINGYVKSINGSALASNLVMIDGARSGTQAMSITGGEGNDTIIMKSNSDVLDAGGQGTGGADTLKVVAQYILGGLAIDLSSTTDQITTTNGSANAQVQKGFEKVDLSGVTGTFGADITAASTGSTIIGTTNADQINGGAGADTITMALTSEATNGVTNVDVIAAAAGVDSLILTGTAKTGTIAQNVIDLSSTTNQFQKVLNITTNVANKMTGIENLDMSALTLSNGVGFTITAHSSGSTITGTTLADAITGGAGNDTITVKYATDGTNGAAAASVDTVAGGDGTADTLILIGAVDGDTLANNVIDLSSATDQVAKIKTTTNVASTVTGFENLDLSGLTITTSPGFTITAAATGSKITGSSLVDSITGGAAVDTIIGGAGADTIVANSNGDIVKYLAATGEAYAGAYTSGATDFDTGGTATDWITASTTTGHTLKIDLSGTGVSFTSGAVTQATTGNGLTGTSGNLALIQATNASGVLTSGGTSTHTLLQFDTNGATAGGIQDVVIVGVFTAASMGTDGVLTLTV